MSFLLYLHISYTLHSIMYVAVCCEFFPHIFEETRVINLVTKSAKNEASCLKLSVWIFNGCAVFGGKDLKINFEWDNHKSQLYVLGAIYGFRYPNHTAMVPKIHSSRVSSQKIDYIRMIMIRREIIHAIHFQVWRFVYLKV
jgi:hypothetical protein